MFDQVWAAIHKACHYGNHMWGIKVGADAGYFLHKLLNVLREIAFPRTGTLKIASLWVGAILGI